MKDNFNEMMEDVLAFINRQKKLSAIILGLVILAIISLFIVVPKVQANIRSSEISSLVSQDKLAKKANYLEAKTADTTIQNKTAMTVLFSVPSGRAYEDVMDILKNSERMKEFNHSIYIYPIVYDAEKIEKKYNIKKNEVTIIFFENGNEKNRLSIAENFDAKTMLIPALNQLPLANIGQSTQPPATSTSTSTTQTTVEEQTTSQEQMTGETVEQPVATDSVAQ